VSEHKNKEKNTRLSVQRAIVCAAGLTNPKNGLLSFIDVPDALQIEAQYLGEFVPYQAHFTVTGHGNYSLKLFWIDANGAECSAGDIPEQLEVQGRKNFCVMVLRMPTSFGRHVLVARWRRPSDTDWNGSASDASYVLELQPPPTTGQPS